MPSTFDRLSQQKLTLGRIARRIGPFSRQATNLSRPLPAFVFACLRTSFRLRNGRRMAYKHFKPRF